MTNNEAERMLRGGAYARQNWLGVHTEWSGHFAALQMTLLHTATKAGLNAQAYLEYVLDGFSRYENGPHNLRELVPEHPGGDSGTVQHGTKEGIPITQSPRTPPFRLRNRLFTENDLEQIRAIIR